MNKLGGFLKSMCKVGCIGFGGGSALIPVIEQEIIKGQKMDSRQNYDKDVMIASITPGALTVKLASALGYRNFGVFGMLSGAYLMALPGAFFSVLCLSILTFMQDKILSFVQILSIIVSVFIICLLLQYVIHMLKSCKKEGKERFQKAFFLMVTVFLLTCGKNVYQMFGIERTPIFAVSTVNILLSAFFLVFALQGEIKGKLLPVVFGLIFLFYLIHGKAQTISNKYVILSVHLLMVALAVRGLWKETHGHNSQKSDKKISLTDVFAWLLIVGIFLAIAIIIEPEIISFAWKGIVSAVFSFGGGSAYLTVADGFFVEGGFITSEQFYGQVVNVVNILPGSVLCKTLTAVGFFTGMNVGKGWHVVVLFVLAGFLISVSISNAIFHLLYEVYDRFEIMRVFKMIHRWIRPIVAGLLLNIILTMINQCVNTAAEVGTSQIAVVIYVLVFALMNLKFMKTVKPYYLILADVVGVVVMVAMLGIL